MRKLITIALLLIAGQAAASEQVISVQHDSSRSVTCWITPQGGISCLPDSLLQQAAPSSEVEQASQTISSVEISPLQATPLPQEKVLQL